MFYILYFILFLSEHQDIVSTLSTPRSKRSNMKQTREQICKLLQCDTTDTEYQNSGLEYVIEETEHDDENEQESIDMIPPTPQNRKCNSNAMIKCKPTVPDQ